MVVGCTLLLEVLLYGALNSYLSLFEISLCIGRRALEFDGTLYFYGRLSNCLFQGNVAYLFGGGCACSVPNSEVAYRNTENVDPIHFEDW